MAFCFDDIVGAVGEVAEHVAETAKEVTTIVGDGVEEFAENVEKLCSKLVENTEECVTELQKNHHLRFPKLKAMVFLNKPQL